MIGSLLRIRYEVLEELDDGPLFAAYRGRDRVAGREVTIRVLQEPFAHERAFLSRLAEVVAKVSSVQHPALERVLELDDHEGTAFLVCEGSPGQRLDERIKRLAPFSAPVSVTHAIGLCEALDALHRAGVVHGDVSARNVIVQSDGKVRLALGGIWNSYSASRTAPAVVLPAMAPYMAPELTDGGMPSPASDVYAVGVVLFELLSGRYPYSADTPVSMALKHATAPVPSLRTTNPSVPVALDEIVRKALSKAPADRYPDARSLLADLRTVQDALRFGKPLSWPIRHTEGPSAAPHQPIAPKMSAVRSEPKQSKARVVPEPDLSDGIPKWLLALGYLAVLASVLMLGGYMAWNFTKPKMVVVPNVEGLSMNDAALRLQDVGLSLKQGRKVTSESKPEGTVLETSPPKGTQVKEHTSIIATTSAGSKFVEVPDLRGRTLEDARELLAKLNLEIQEPVRRVRSRSIDPGLIVSQIPEPRRKVERLSRIRVDVSADRDQRITGDESTAIRNTYNLRVVLPAGEVPILVRIDMTDDNGTKTVFEEQRGPSDVIELETDGVGKEATFRIFFDGEIVRQVTKRADDLDEPTDAGGGR